MGRPSALLVSSGGDSVLMIESAVDTITTGAVDVSHGDTCRTGAFRRSAVAAVSDGSGWVQQSIAAPDETQGCSSPVHEGICEACMSIAPGTQVTTAEATTATMTQSATTPATRLRIASIMNRRRSLLSTCSIPCTTAEFLTRALLVNDLASQRGRRSEVRPILTVRPSRLLGNKTAPRRWPVRRALL